MCLSAFADALVSVRITASVGEVSAGTGEEKGSLTWTVTGLGREEGIERGKETGAGIEATSGFDCDNITDCVRV